MITIDLTLQIENGMPVYPWDPEVNIEEIQKIENWGWNMKRISINWHDWTHVNVPLHCKNNWKNLDDYSVEDFFGESSIFEKIEDIKKDYWILFIDKNLDLDLVKIILEKKPKFVLTSSKFEVNEEAQKLLLKNEIILFERIANTEKLPKKFFFYWVPLKIKEWDWSPVRAFARF